MRDERITRAIHETPWAILPEKLEAILDVVHLHATRGTVPDLAAFDEEKPEPEIVARSSGGGEVRGGIAVLPLFGIVAQRMDMLMAFSGGTSTERFGRDFKAALADERVSTVLIEVDSPGGSVYGVEELASLIFDSRGEKKIVALANSVAASAAYWIASAADEFVVTPGGEVGSIGVIAIHQDISKMEEDAGISTTLISAGKFKTEGNEHEPLSDEAASAIQARVDGYYAKFVNAVARGRGVSASDVRRGFGEGRVVASSEARKLGMVDRIATRDQTIARLLPKRARAGAMASGMSHDTRVRRQRFRETTGSGAVPAP